MRFFTLLLLLILTITGAIASLNWAAFITPTDLWLGFAAVRMPVGLLMLGLLVAITVLFLLSANLVAAGDTSFIAQIRGQYFAG